MGGTGGGGGGGGGGAGGGGGTNDFPKGSNKSSPVSRRNDIRHTFNASQDSRHPSL